MDFSKIYFGKDQLDLQYQDLVAFFQSAKEESNKIEFKSFSINHSTSYKDLPIVTRSICAFLNSEGGIVIWGAPQGKKIPGQHSKSFQGSLTPLSDKFEKDWLISKISDLITPLPVGIQVIRLESNNKYLYIFEIQPSLYRPHMYNDIYWVRLDGQTKPAPHYLIEALFKQISYPNLEGYIKFNSISQNNEKIFINISILIFNYTKLQNEEKVSFRLLLIEGYFSNYFTSNVQGFYISEGQQLVFERQIDVLHYGTPAIHDETIVIFKGDPKFENGRKVNLLLSFGGRKSPIKTSFYTLDLNKIDWNNTTLPNYLISDKDENKLLIEAKKEIQPLKEEELRIILGR